MQERLSNIKTGTLYQWRAIPLITLLLSGVLTFQAIGKTEQQTKPSAQVTPIMRVDPIYPDYAVKRGLEGMVVLSFSIETDGSVADVEVIKSDHDGLFDASAILALQQWSYTKPAAKQHNVQVALEFLLDDESSTNVPNNMEKISVSGD